MIAWSRILAALRLSLRVRKPDDDLGGTLLVGASPQIELGDNGIECLYQEGGRFRLESPSLQHAPYWHDRALQVVEGFAASQFVPRPGSTARAFYAPAFASRRMTSLYVSPGSRIWPSRLTNSVASQIRTSPSGPGRGVALAVPRSDVLMAL